MKKFAVMAAGLSAAVLAGSLMTTASAQTIKIGVIEPLTGPFAASGNYVTNGAKIAADEINAKGGVLGQKIELVIEDNKSNPTEAASVAEKLHIKKADFLVINNDWGLGTAQDFSKMFKEHGITVGMVETMDQAAQDMSAQLAKFKNSDADTLIVTSAVEQLTLVFKQAAALGLKKQIITTGGSQNPDQLIDQAGTAVNGTLHLTTFAPWVPEVSPDPEATKNFIAEWKKRGFQFAGVTESFRGYDGIRTIAAAIQKA